MKKLALVIALFMGAATTVSAQDAKSMPKEGKEVPRFAQPRNDAEKPVIARAQNRTDEMVKKLNLDERQALTMLEINVSMERTIAALPADDPNRADVLKEVEQRRDQFYREYLTPAQYEAYKKIQAGTQD